MVPKFHIWNEFGFAEFLYFFTLPSRDDHYAIQHARIIIIIIIM
jgi:hypothetical protein